MAIFLGCFGMLFIVLGISAGMGALTMVALGAFGVHVSFWVAWAVYIILSSIFSAVLRKSD